MRAKSASVLKPHGVVQETNWDGSISEFDTLQCCHCGTHWKVVKGSGKRRGFCMKCMGPTCGKKGCDTECKPYARLFDGEV